MSNDGIATSKINRVLTFLKRILPNGPMYDLTVAVISYNSLDDLQKNLQSLKIKSNKLNLNVVVVDNASTDGSQEMVRRHFPQVTLVANPQNLFFSGAINQVLKGLKGGFVLVSNADVLYNVDALERMCEFLSKNPVYGGVISQVFDATGKIQPVIGTFPKWYDPLLKYTLLRKLSLAQVRIRAQTMDDYDYQNETDAEVIMDGCAMFRVDALQEVGLYDDSIKLWATEDDICFRLGKRGYKLRYLTSCRVVHNEHGSVSRVQSEVINKLHRADILTFTKKHFGVIPWTVIKGSWLAVDSAKKVKQILGQ